MSNTKRFSKQQVQTIHKKFVKSREKGNETIDQFCAKHKVPSQAYLVYLFKRDNLKYPKTNITHTESSVRETLKKLDKFLENPKNKVPDFFKSQAQMNVFYKMAKQFNVPMTHRRAKKRIILTDLSGSMSSSETQKPVMIHQPTFISPVKEKKKGFLSRFLGN